MSVPRTALSHSILLSVSIFVFRLSQSFCTLLTTAADYTIHYTTAFHHTLHYSISPYTALQHFTKHHTRAFNHTQNYSISPLTTLKYITIHKTEIFHHTTAFHHTLPYRIYYTALHHTQHYSISPHITPGFGMKIVWVVLTVNPRKQLGDFLNFGHLRS